MGTDPEQAAEAAVDVERLLDGEDPTSRDPEDAAHWTAVYQELVGFKNELLGATRAQLGVMTPAAAREVEATDLVVMETEAARLRRRLAFWKGRAAEIVAERK